MRPLTPQSSPTAAAPEGALAQGAPALADDGGVHQGDPQPGQPLDGPLPEQQRPATPGDSLWQGAAATPPPHGPPQPNPADPYAHAQPQPYPADAHGQHHPPPHPVDAHGQPYPPAPAYVVDAGGQWYAYDAGGQPYPVDAYGQPLGVGHAPPGYVAAPQLADRIPGAVEHGVYEQQYAQMQAQGTTAHPPRYDGPPIRKSGWNAPGYGLMAIFVLALAAVIWPQIKARQTEATLRPLVAAIAERDAGARCPRYITAVFTNAGSVSFDENGNASDRTDLTAPVCEGAKFAFSERGRRELACLETSGSCPEEAIAAVVALNVIAHEAIHLRGETDEGRAECISIGEGARIASVVGLSAEQGKMLAWVHYQGMNPFTPAQYNVEPGSCDSAAALEQSPPAMAPELRDRLTAEVGAAWATLGDD